MSRNSDYKNLKELTKYLAKGIDKLESGKLSTKELTSLLEDARTLYERVTVLQYLAFDKEVKATREGLDSKKIKKDEKKQHGSFELNFGTLESKEEITSEPLGGGYPSQTNLLDAIEEHVDEGADITAKDTVEKLQKTLSKEENITKTTKNEVIESIAESKSINEKFANQNEGKTLADKLSRQPISDLKEAIGLNQKFLFMNDLFQGENTLFNKIVEKLNSLHNLEDAMDYIDSNLVVKYNWNKEHQSVMKFIDLVERRFMA